MSHRGVYKNDATQLLPLDGVIGKDEATSQSLQDRRLLEPRLPRLFWTVKATARWCPMHFVAASGTGGQ